MKKFISIVLMAVMLCTAPVCSFASDEVVLSVSANKTEFLTTEIITLSITYLRDSVLTAQTGEEFTCERLRMVIDDGNPGLYQTKAGVTSLSVNLVASDFSVGSHTVTVYNCSTYVGRYDPNGASFTFTVSETEENTVFSQSFDGGSFIYNEETYNVTDSTGVLKSTDPGRYVQDETDYLDSYFKVAAAVGTGASGNALYNYNLNAGANKSALYKNKHFGIAEYDMKSTANNGIIRLKMRYSYPSAYTNTSMMFMPFVLTDELGGELIVGRVCTNTQNTYYLGGTDFASTSVYVYKFTPDYDVWHELEYIYDCDSGTASMLLDGEIKAANVGIGKLSGNTITTVKTVASYRQNAVSAVATDDVSAVTYSKAAQTQPLFELESASLSAVDGNVTMNLSFINTTGGAADYTAIVAVYNGNKLEKLITEKGSVESSGSSVEKSLILENAGTYTSAKGIVLESLETLKPMGAPVTK